MTAMGALGLDALLDELEKRGASTLHLAAGQSPHARLESKLVPLRETAIGREEAEALVSSLLSPAQRERLAAGKRLTAAVDRSGVRYRLDVSRTAEGACAVLRLVPTRVPSLAELGCPEALWRIVDGRPGLLLVAGPPGSGRSTTAAALVDQVNKTRACHVVTIEDPIEVVHEPRRAQVTQREVTTHVASREAALRAAFEDDAQVVYVSELATTAEAMLACELAASGLLVIATTSASGVVDALERLVPEEPEAGQVTRGMLASALLGVVAQRLVPGEGRSHVVAHEILLASPTVATAVREGHTAQLVSVMQSGAAAGMQTHDMALERLLQLGRISADTALEMAADREAVAKIVTRHAGGRAKPS